MTNEEIKEKYGIEPIMKEMWVWDEYMKQATFRLVLFFDNEDNMPYCTLGIDNDFVGYINASETNPNEIEPKIGDKGYFWDDEESSYCFDTLAIILESFPEQYGARILGTHFKHFSHEKQTWMK